jgi:hypothetical protein
VRSEGLDKLKNLLASSAMETATFDLASQCLNQLRASFNFFFKDFPIFLQSVYIHSNTISKLCVEKRGRVEECSVTPLRDKRVKNFCGCREKSVQTKEKYKLRLTTKAYKLSSLNKSKFISIVTPNLQKSQNPC